MKTPIRLFFFSLLTFCAIRSGAQTGPSETHDFITYDTTLHLNYSGAYWIMRITRLRNMFVANSPDTASRPVIIAMNGVGEVGSNSALTASYGPHYWLNNGWDGGIQLGNGKHYPIIITIQWFQAWPSNYDVHWVVDYILNTYHVKKNSVHVCGLSMGSMAWTAALQYENTAGDEHGMSQIKSMVALEGEANIATNYSAMFGHWAKKYGGKFMGLEGTADYRGVWYVSQPMNDSFPGSAYFAYENLGGGSHCCWNTMYSPSELHWNATAPMGSYITLGSAPNTPGTYMNGDYIFKWMLKQGDTSLVGSGTSVNQPPVANAGSNQTITLPVSTVNLSGSGSDPDGTIASYAWSQVSGTAATIVNPSSASTTVNGLLVAGNYVFRLTVTDNAGASATSNVTITVNPINQTPVANAGSNQTIILPTTTTMLTGSGSEQNGTIVAYSWTQVSGAAATIANPSTAVTPITGLATTGTRVFQLAVTDNIGNTATSNVTIAVNTPSSSGQSIPGHIEAESYNTMSGVGIYPASDVISNQCVGSIDNGDWIDYNVNVAVSGVYNVSFRVATPNNGAQFLVRKGTTVLLIQSIPNTGGWQNWTTITANISLVAGSQTLDIYSIANGWNLNWMDFSSTSTPANQPPVANAGADQTITLPVNSTLLNGTASTDDHNIVAYQWTKLTGIGGSLTSSAASTTSFSGLTAGTYTVELRVTDDSGAVARDTVQINVNASLPSGKTIPGHIEGETYDNMSGVGIYAASDGGAGQCVGSIDNGDWMDYNVNVTTTGVYTVNFRVATPNNGAQFQVRNGSTILSTVAVTNTGGWQNWATVTVSISLTAGTQTLRIYSFGSGWNLNWADFSLSAPSSRMASTSVTTEQEPANNNTNMGPALKLFPNPVHDQFTLQMNNDYSGPVDIRVFDQAGGLRIETQFTKTKKADQLSIPVQKLSPGMYIIKVKTAGWNDSIKMVKL